MRTQIEVVRSFWPSADGHTLTLLTASTRTRLLQPKPVRNDIASIEEAMDRLERTHLVGALDLGRALNEAKPLLSVGKILSLVHVGSGIAAMGEGKVDQLVKRLPRAALRRHRRGRRWNRSFMQAAAEASGGYLTQVNPTSRSAGAAWRLPRRSTRRAWWMFTSRIRGNARWLPFTRLVCQGEEVAPSPRRG